MRRLLALVAALLVAGCGGADSTPQVKRGSPVDRYGEQALGDYGSVEAVRAELVPASDAYVAGLRPDGIVHAQTAQDGYEQLLSRGRARQGRDARSRDPGRVPEGHRRDGGQAQPAWRAHEAGLHLRAAARRRAGRARPARGPRGPGHQGRGAAPPARPARDRVRRRGRGGRKVGRRPPVRADRVRAARPLAGAGPQHRQGLRAPARRRAATGWPACASWRIPTAWPIRWWARTPRCRPPSTASAPRSSSASGYLPPAPRPARS